MEWADGDVEDIGNTNKLNIKQEGYLLDMMEALRRTDVLSAEAAMKGYIESNDMWDAKCEWEDLTQDEQNALWVAPSYGGVFTTEERKVIKDGFKGA